MEGWTSNNQTEPDALWEWVLGGDVGGAVFGPTGTLIQSPSGVDGAAVFNADFLTSGGSPQELFDNLFHYYRSELVSPVIDLTCTETPLELQFSQLLKKGNVAPNAPQSETTS